MSPTSRDDEVGADLREVGVPVATVWTEPAAPREVDRPALLDDPAPSAWLSAMDVDSRRGLHGRTLTQLLAGDAVRVVEERGDWVCVVALGQPSSLDPSGYPGWVRRAHLAPPAGAPDTADRATVVASFTTVALPDGTSRPLSLCTCLPVVAVAADGVRLLLPGGRRGGVPAADVAIHARGERPAYAPEDVLATARRFLGLKYLWGGTSSWGVDCSGLVYLTYRAHGVEVPRDASDQAAAVEPVPLDDVRPGDLYFFARPGRPVYHVGFVTRPVAADGTRWMLHAPEAGERVEDAPLAPDRTEALVSAGRIRRPETPQRASRPPR